MVDYVNAQAESWQVFDEIENVKRYGELEIDVYRRIITKNNKEIKLTFMEFEIF